MEYAGMQIFFSSLTLMTEKSLLILMVLNPTYVTLHAEYLKAPHWGRFCF